MKIKNVTTYLQKNHKKYLPNNIKDNFEEDFQKNEKVKINFIKNN